MIDFWASWCRPCIQAFPEIAKFHKSLSEEDNITVLGLSIDKEISDAKTTALSHRVGWTVGQVSESAKESKSIKSLGVSSVPTYLVLDPNGKIIFRGFNHEQAIKVLRELK